MASWDLPTQPPHQQSACNTQPAITPMVMVLAKASAHTAAAVPVARPVQPAIAVRCARLARDFACVCARACGMHDQGRARVNSPDVLAVADHHALLPLAQ
jgi:hypothetical protein